MGYYLRQFFMAAIPAAILFSCLYPFRRAYLSRRSLYSSCLREIGLVVFVMCLFGLLAMVFRPGHRFTRWFPLDGVNLVPFQIIKSYFQDFATENVGSAIILFFGNMGTFLPLGFFLPLLFRGWNTGKIACFGAGFSLSVEFVQYFLGRHCDVDDVLLNVVGVMMGYWLFALLKKLLPHLISRFHCERIE